MTITIQGNGKHVASKCTICGYNLDRFIMPYKAVKPRPHDVTVCLQCASVLIFNDDFSLREPSLDEMTSWGQDIHDDIVRLQAKIRSMKMPP